MSISCRRSSASWPLRRALKVGEHEVHVGAAGQDIDALRRASSSARIAAPRRVRCWRSLNSSLAAILKATALPAMMCISGPPCWPGKTAELIFFRTPPWRGSSAASAADRLVDRGRDDVCVRAPGRVLARGDKSREVGHVDHQHRADVIGDLAERREVELARVGATSRRRSASACAPRQPGDVVHVDPVVRLRARRKKRCRRACPRR